MENKSILLSSDQFFKELVDESCKKRNVKINNNIKGYLVGVLEHYLDARNLFETEVNEVGEKNHQTLAEMYLVATQKPSTEKQILLKKLGDRTLYVSGFFADSLHGKMVDVDYYTSMGEMAYGTLAELVREELSIRIYKTFSQRFIEFVDVLNHISHSAMIQNDENILRLYDRYMRTGSELAREKLIEMGVTSVSKEQTKRSKQD
jgi:hypothetical protein